VAAERSAALEGLERLHAWLAARHAQVSLPGLAALRGAAREAALLAEVERAARHALAATPVATRAALAEVGERGLFVAGRGSRGASAAAALIAAALRAWPAQSSGRAPAELPRLHLIGEADARVIFWGRVAEQVEAHATAAPQPRDDR
jgi:hypothetical protein